MNQKESRKRLLILLLSYIGLLAMLGGYVIAYFGYYYPVIIRHDTKLYFKGHLLIFAFWFPGICTSMYQCFFLSADGDDPRLVDSSGSAAADAHWADCVRRILYLAVLPHLQEAFPAKAAAADLWRSSH